MKALLLAAGYATRLYPLTKEFPKPLLTVKDKPIIEYIVEKLQELDSVDEIIIVTNSKFIGLFKEWRAQTAYQKKISLVDDLTSSKEDRRGAIGDMHFVIQKNRIRDDLVVVGGDNIFTTGLKPFLSFAKAHEPFPVIGVYDIAKKALASQFGVVQLDAKGTLVDFKEKPQKPRSALVAMCLYYFPQRKVGLVKEYMDSRQGFHDAIGLYIDWLRKKETVYGFIFKGSWFDIGHHSALAEAKQKFPS